MRQATRTTQQLARLCQTFDMGLSMHSNSHLGISLIAMTHLAASVPHLAYACDTHYPWQDEEVVQGGRLKFENGSLRVPSILLPRQPQLLQLPQVQLPPLRRIRQCLRQHWYFHAGLQAPYLCRRRQH